MERDIDRRALEFIRGSKGRVSYRQIGNAIGLRSTGSVYNILQRLQIAGHIERRDFYHRDIRLTNQRNPAVSAEIWNRPQMVRGR